MLFSAIPNLPAEAHPGIREAWVSGPRADRSPLRAGGEITLSLGGSPPPPWLRAAVGGHRDSVIQTSADENDPSAPARAADVLAALDVAETVMVTAGRQGAIARALSARRSRPGQAAPGRRRGVLRRADPLRSTPENLAGCLRYACAAGGLWCSLPPGHHVPAPGDTARAVCAPADGGEDKTF